MNGFKRVLSAPKLLVGLFLFQLIFVALSSAPVYYASRVAVGQNDVLVDRHFIATVVELALTQPAWASTLFSVPVIVGVVGFLFWQISSAGNLSRLARPIDLISWTAECITFALSMLVFRGYIFVLQMMLIVPTIFLLLRLDPWTKVLFLCIAIVLLAILAFVQDLSRARIVIHKAHRYHPKSLVNGLQSMLRHPGTSGLGVALVCAQWTITIILLYWTTQHFHESTTLWFARLFTLIPLFLGLWRMALAIEISPDQESSNA